MTVSGFWVSHSTVQSLNSVWINCRTRSSVSRSTQGRGSSTSRIRTFASRALAKQSSLLWPKLSQHRSRNISLITTTCLLCHYIKVAIEKTILFHEVIKQCDGPDLNSWLTHVPERESFQAAAKYSLVSLHLCIWVHFLARHEICTNYYILLQFPKETNTRGSKTLTPFTPFHTNLQSFD